jgi:hypothetical protein
MNLLLIILQMPAIENREDIGVISVLSFLVMALCSAIVYIYKTKNQELKSKDDRIMEVIKEHQNDLKDANNDYRDVLEKYHQFTQQIKEIANAKRGS